VSAAQPIWIPFGGAEPPARRTVDAALFARFPALLQALVRLTLALPRRSRLRQALIRRATLQAMGAWTRGDFELGLMRYAPDVVLTAGESDLARLDFELPYRGREGVRAFVQTYQDAFGDQSYEPGWIVDLGGDEFVLLVHHSLSGRASGAEVEQVTAQRVQLRKGLVVREEIHTAAGHDWEPVVRQVGLETPADLAEWRSA
jgi:SnoaL-like domain